MLFLLRRFPVKTLKHLPKFLPKDEDFKNTALISDDEHEKLRLNILDVKNQFFVKTATWGLSDWERVLDLSVKENATLNDRRTQILLKLLGAQTVTETFMNDLINMFCEYGSGYIIQHNPEYWFELCVSGDEDVKWDELIDAVNTYKPAHLGFKIVIYIISEILIEHEADIIQYINSGQNFWNIGAAIAPRWDGKFNWDGEIDWSGAKGDENWRENQTFIVEIIAKTNCVEVFSVKHEAGILFKIKQDLAVQAAHESSFSQHEDARHVFWNLGAAKYTHWDGKFDWNGDIDWSGAKGDENWRENQTFIVEILAKTDSVEVFSVKHEAGILFKIKPELAVQAAHESGFSQHEDARHVFWNLGAAKYTHWDGKFNWDGEIDWSGRKGDERYKDRQFLVLDVSAFEKSTGEFLNVWHSTETTSGHALKQEISTGHNLNYIYYTDSGVLQEASHAFIETASDAAAQKCAGTVKNLFDGSFCLDGAHAFEESYAIDDAQTENLCVFYYIDKDKNIKEGSFERL